MKFHQPVKKHNRLKVIFLLIPLSGLWFIYQGGYIHAKALLAQILLDAAWTRTIHGEKEVKPWPWADTWPISRLSVPRLGIDRIVLAGTSGSSLAFGPGHFLDSASPGKYGNTVIAGHRDTHFYFLKNLRPGDNIKLQSSNGDIFIYRVRETMIVNENESEILDADSTARLTLITCYPFNSIQTGGPLRYVVIAERMARYKQA